MSVQVSRSTSSARFGSGWWEVLWYLSHIGDRSAVQSLFIGQPGSNGSYWELASLQIVPRRPVSNRPCEARGDGAATDPPNLTDDEPASRTMSSHRAGGETDR
jgi:hypothetical protein